MRRVVSMGPPRCHQLSWTAEASLAFLEVWAANTIARWSCFTGLFFNSNTFLPKKKIVQKKIKIGFCTLKSLFLPFSDCHLLGSVSPQGDFLSVHFHLLVNVISLECLTTRRFFCFFCERFTPLNLRSRLWKFLTVCFFSSSEFLYIYILFWCRLQILLVQSYFCLLEIKKF